MNTEVLIPGLDFAKKYALTPKEVYVLCYFFGKTYTNAELTAELNANKTTLNAVIQRLKLKGLLVLKNRDTKGSSIFQFNEEILN